MASQTEARSRGEHDVFETADRGFLLLPVAIANAALITVDTDLGAQTGVIDTTTSLTWLKVSATAGLTLRQVLHRWRRAVAWGVIAMRLPMNSLAD